MRIIELEQKTDAWLLWRASGIGASECAAALGLSKYKTPAQLWEEKTGRAFIPPMNADMQRGVDLEDEARHNFEFIHGKVFVPICAQHSTHDFILASLDGLSSSLTEFIEIKCPRSDKLLRICASKNVSTLKKEYIEYWCQIQHQYAVTDAEFAYLVAYMNQNIEYMPIERDNKFIEEVLIPGISSFWNDFVKIDKQPPMSDKDCSYTSDESCIALAKELCSIETQINKLEEMKGVIRDSLKEKTGNKSTVIGNVLKIAKYVTSHVDYKGACEENCIDMSKYKKPDTTAFRFSMID